jgi:asparaginyl-tRNA synthetase
MAWGGYRKLKYVRISELGEHLGEEIEIRGWLYNKRSSGKIQFLIIRDGTGEVQGVLAKADVGEELFTGADHLTQESSLIVKGFVRSEPRAVGGFELTLTGFSLVSGAEEYPISLKEHGVDFLMDHRHLWMRTPRQAAILRVRSEIIKAMRDFLEERDFVCVDAPILTPAACEGTTTLFETDYFEWRAYLSQSGQLYNEATCMALGKVYCFGPAFRAEKSKTRRHLMEFWMLEPEMAYCDQTENLQVQEELVSYVVQRVLQKRMPELKTIGRDTSKLEKITPPFPRLKYEEAIAVLKEKGVDTAWGNDFGGGDETILAGLYEKPVFVTDYPTQTKAFYMKPDPNRPEVVLCADLLAPEGYGEIIGGSQRIDDPDLLSKRFQEHGLSPESYGWYMDLRRYGSVPHSGFGIGVERTVAWICGLEHVRETIPFARMLNRIYP